MTREQFNALCEYIDAKIDEKIEDAFGRDGLSETIRASKLECEAWAALKRGDDD